jgi:hypothetical protein
MKIGTAVEIVSAKYHGKTGVVTGVHSCMNTLMWLVRLDPVTNVQNQVFDLGQHTFLSGQLREISTLEQLAAIAEAVQ